MLRLDATGQYVEDAMVEGDERHEVREPFVVTVCPADLVA